MTEDQIQQCKQSLLQLQKEHQALEQKLAKSGDASILDQTSVGRLSRMDAMQSQRMALETLRNNEMHADNIEGGLRRIELGDFGHCFYCEQEIPFPRLEADPTNTCCAKCAEATREDNTII